MQKEELESVLIDTFATLNIILGILNTLIEEKAISEDLNISKKYFPKGGLNVIKNKLEDLYLKVHKTVWEKEMK